MNFEFLDSSDDFRAAPAAQPPLAGGCAFVATTLVVYFLIGCIIGYIVHALLF